MSLIITDIKTAKDKMSDKGWTAYCKDSVELDNFDPNLCTPSTEIAIEAPLAKYKYEYT
jgi:hypothetical protein